MKMKRMVTFITMVAFLMLAVTSAYASFTDIDTNPHKDAIEEMSRLGILAGVGNNLYNPDVVLDRAAAAKVAAFLLGYTQEDADAAADWEPIFIDVHKGMPQHGWALGWINLVANDDVIRGVSSGEYLPGKELLMVEWAAILTRILGHEEDGMAWPNAYNQKAETLGLTASLNYTGNSVVNRAQMARMTNTAINDVERPDGKKIIDIVEFNTETESEHVYQEEQDNEESENGGDEQQEEVYENVSMSLSASKSLLPDGGGQSTQLTAYVTHNDLPAEGAPVSFFAFIEEGGIDRTQQLSANEAVTGADGKATVTYTSLAADDNKYIYVRANTRDDEDADGWQDSNNVYVVAASNASQVEGRVVNPFTGDPYPNAGIGFLNKHTNQYNFFGETTDDNGHYSVPVIAGEYYISIDLDMGDKTYYSGSYTGSHHDFKSDNTITLRANDFVVQGNKNYTLNTEMGVIKGVVNNLGSHRNIYITRSGSATDTVIADVNGDGSFMISVPEGNYEICAQGGHFLKQSVNVEKGKVTNLGTFSR